MNTIMSVPSDKNRTEAAVRQALDYIESNLEEKLTLDELASEVGLSPYHLQRSFRASMGLTPKQYIDKKRMQKFKERLRQGTEVLDASLDAGFVSLREPYEKSTQHLGMTPGQYRRGGRGVSISYALAESTLGLLLLASTGRGICALYLGDDVKELERELQLEFPEASLYRRDGKLDEQSAAVVEYVSGRRREPRLSLDIIGTEFQRTVWEALRKIPYGETRSYQEVADMIGKPTATRAVASACAKNKVSLLIPCHRVVRSDGTISGYRWQPDRKRKLLAMEAEGPAE